MIFEVMNRPHLPFTAERLDTKVATLVSQTEQHTRALAPFFAPVAATWNVRHIRIVGQRIRDFLGSINPSDLEETVTRLRDSLADGVRAFGFSLCANDVRLSLLLGLLDNEPCPLSVLLCNLFLLDGSREFPPKCHVRNGDIFEGDVEFTGTTQEVCPDAV